MRFRIWILVFALGIVTDKGSSKAHAAPKFGVLVGGGSPAPSWFGGGIVIELDPVIDFVASSGWSRWDDLRVFAVAPQLRLSVLQTELTPVVGGGLNLLFLGGSGTLQNLESESDGALPLPFLFLGAKYRAVLTQQTQFNINLGVNLHFPVKLIFPLIEAEFKFN